MARIDFSRLRLLVVDDNLHMRKVIKTLLHGFGARDIFEAEDGPRGYEEFNQCVPDIILLDWAMPGYDGLELTKKIRQPEKSPNPFVPIIMITGHTERHRVTAARDAGITEFLAKPIAPKALYQRLYSVIAQPRPFIKTKTFFGPDRRRISSINYTGPERRKSTEGDVIRQQALLDRVTVTT